MTTCPKTRESNADGAALEARIAALELELEAMKAREAAWTRREQELADFVENAVVGLHKVGPDGTILWANRADYGLLGYTREEYVGHNIAEFHADEANLQCIMRSLLEGEALREYPAVLRCKDGSLRHVLISSNGHFEQDRFVNTRCFTRDVTGQKAAEAALSQTRNSLAAIVESSEDSIIGCDLDGRIGSWNRGAERILGYGREEVIGRPILDIVPPELHEEEREVQARVRAGERPGHYETYRLRKDGSRVEMSITVSPVHDAAGRLVGISKVGRDVSERNRAQRELAEAARRKDEFLAILSHELRNPLAPIRYAVSIENQENSTPEQRRRASEVVARQVEHMGRLLDDLLDVSRIARGHVELRKRWVDLAEVVEAATDAAGPLLRQRGHRLEVRLPAERMRLEADPVRLVQILSNLLNNAAKYSDDEGRIVLAARREDGHVVVAVRDEGIGIAPEMMPRLFTLFAQSAPALHRSQGGLGIGLALVKGFVELHGGTIEARSEGRGKGSEFVVRLPVGEAAGRGREEGEARPASSRVRVLVADDNADSALTCATLLELWGHEVVVAHGGAEALELAARTTPDVALIDIGMPRMNGYEVARRLRQLPAARSARLVAVTGWGQDEDKQRALDAGFDHHLTKPVDPARLRPLVEGQ